MWSHSKLNKPDSIILHAFYRISILITKSFLYFHEWMIVDALDFLMDDVWDLRRQYENLSFGTHAKHFLGSIALEEVPNLWGTIIQKSSG